MRYGASRRARLALLFAVASALIGSLVWTSPVIAAQTATTTFFNGPTSSYRELQTLMMEVTPAPDGGLVEVEVDGQVIGSTTFVENPVFLTWTPPANGTYTMQAFFRGTAAFAASESEATEASFSSPPLTSVTVEASDDPVLINTDVTFTATLDPDPGSGDVEWYVGGVLQATTDVESDGTASWTTSFPTVGTRELKANFTGNALYNPRMSQPFGFFVSKIPVTMTLTVADGPFAPGLVDAQVSLEPNPGAGVLRWRPCEFCIYTEVALDPDGTTDLSIGPFVGGAYHVFVAFVPDEGDYGSAEDDVFIQVHETSTTTLATDRTTAYQGELPVKLTATVTSAGSINSGTVTFFDHVEGVVVELGPVAVNTTTHQAVLSSSSLRIGSHSVTAKYNGQSGNAEDGILASTSSAVTFSVLADAEVHATFAASLAKFYAAKDGYIDTVKLGGTLDEEAKVTIRLYNGAGTLKRRWKLGSEQAGPYSVTWNGKTASGSRLAAGKYTVKATIEDTDGHRKTYTAKTSLSWREVVWKTVTVQKNGDTGTFFVGENGGGVFLSPYYAHGIIFDSGEMIGGCDDCGYAAGRYRFTVVTSNVLAYRKSWTEVRGHGFVDREHTGQTSVVDPATGEFGESMPNPEFDVSSQTHNLLFGPEYIDENGRIEIWVWMTQAWGDAFDLKYLKLNYQYAVWK